MINLITNNSNAQYISVIKAMGNNPSIIPKIEKLTGTVPETAPLTKQFIDIVLDNTQSAKTLAQFLTQNPLLNTNIEVADENDFLLSFPGTTLHLLAMQMKHLVLIVILLFLTRFVY